MPQVFYNDPLRGFLDGAWYDDGDNNDAISLVNSNPQAVEIWTLTVDSATNSKLYTINIANIPVSYTSDASATVNEIAEGLRDAVEAEGALGFVDPTVSGAVLTLTGRQEGLTFDVSESDADLSLVNTQDAARAEPVPFGRLIVRTADASDGTKQGRLVNASDFDGASATLSFTADNSQPYHFDITIDGVTYPVDYTSDGTATAAEIAAGLKADLDAFGLAVTATVDGDDLDLQADGGVNFVLSDATAGGSGAISIDSYSAFSKPSVYIAARSDVQVEAAQYNSSGDLVDGYQRNSTMAAARKGRIVVGTEASPSFGDEVYVRVAADGSNDDIGALSNASGTGLVRIDNLYRMSWYDGAPATSGVASSQGVLQLD